MDNKKYIIIYDHITRRTKEVSTIIEEYDTIEELNKSLQSYLWDDSTKLKGCFKRLSVDVQDE